MYLLKILFGTCAGVIDEKFALEKIEEGKYIVSKEDDRLGKNWNNAVDLEIVEFIILKNEEDITNNFDYEIINKGDIIFTFKEMIGKQIRLISTDPKKFKSLTFDAYEYENKTGDLLVENIDSIKDFKDFIVFDEGVVITDDYTAKIRDNDFICKKRET